MTFYEAAVAVLREAGRPLHFKKITALSIQQDLLSHVGKKPEDTMSARLSQEAKKPSDQSAIDEVRPGVFGIREGVDLGDVAQTIKLREPIIEEEEEPVVEETEEATDADDQDDDQSNDEQNDEQDDEQDDDSGDAKRSRGRRRGGRGRKKSTEDTQTV
ncbi:MAG: TATA-binding protein-associated factor Taf7, partial [Bradymonadia bacterium]